jgi:hypothetical protein
MRFESVRTFTESYPLRVTIYNPGRLSTPRHISGASGGTVSLWPELLSDSEVPILYSIGIYTSCVSFGVDDGATMHPCTEDRHTLPARTQPSLRDQRLAEPRYWRVANPYQIETSGEFHLHALEGRAAEGPPVTL